MPTASGPEQLTSADLNHDCLPDFVVAANLGKAVSVLLAKAGGGYEPAAKYDFGMPKFYPAEGFASSYLALADLDGDGSLDVASTKRLSDIVGVLRNKGNGSFGPELTYPTGTDPYGLIAGDFDLDGAPDIALAAYTGNSLTLLSNVACSP